MNTPMPEAATGPRAGTSLPSPTRRRLLAGGLAGAGAIAAGATAFALTAQDSEDAPAYACWRQQEKGKLGDLEYLVLCATLAPSPHNTQPWRFRLEGDSILVHADLTRHLGAADAQFRMMQVGLGCAIENLDVAAARLGYRCRIDLDAADRRFAADGHCARIELTRGPVERRPVFDAMFRRQTTRAAFDAHADVPAALRSRLAQAADGLPGVRLHWLRASAIGDPVGDVVRTAARDYLSDERHRAGMKWFRIKRAEWEQRRDGIAVFNTDAPALAKQYVEHFVGPADVMGPAFRDSEIASVDRLSAATPLWGLIVADGAGARQRLLAGRLAERIYLQATALGLAIQPMCYPTETPTGAAALRRLADVPDGHEPVFLFRLGRSGLVARSVAAAAARGHRLDQEDHMSHVARRLQSAGEEAANSLSHGFGAVVAALFSPQLMDNAFRAGPAQGLAATVYCASLILLFSVSAAYHWLPRGAAKELLRRLDHAAIFLFIAGSYTPFMLGRLAQEGGYWVLALVWLVATAGTVAKCANRLTQPALSTAIYLGLGWLSVFILEPLGAIPTEGLALMVCGGGLYTLGAIVFHFGERVRYAHFVWHLLVLGASGCHFVAVLRYVAA